MAITTQAQIQAALPGQIVTMFKTGPTIVTTSFISDWKNGVSPAAGATPATGAGAVPTSATAGAIPFTDAPGGSAIYIARAMGYFTNGRRDALILYDRLVHTSGLDGTVTTAQTVNTVAITRGDTNGSGVEGFLEVYTAMGATPTTATIAYTDSSGTAQTCTITIPASAGAGMMFPFLPAAGENGIRSVQSVTLTGSTGTAGNFGVTLARKVLMIYPPTGAATAESGPGKVASWRETALTKVENGACLSMVHLNPAVAAVTYSLALNLITA